LNHREQVRVAKVEQSCQEVRRIAIKLYSEGIDPNRSHIARYLSKPAYFREPLVVASLETVRWELNLEEQSTPNFEQFLKHKLNAYPTYG
jgi:hypothetical protein